MTDQDGERSLVRLASNGKGERSWSVSVRAGDDLDALMAALEVALRVADRLEEEDRPPAD